MREEHEEETILAAKRLKRHKRDSHHEGTKKKGDLAADFGGCFLRWGGLGWCVLTPASGRG